MQDRKVGRAQRGCLGFKGGLDFRSMIRMRTHPSHVELIKLHMCQRPRCSARKRDAMKMARAALAIGARDLARLAGVSAMTVTRFENGHSQGYLDTLGKLRAALESAGVIFVAENGEGPGVRLRKPSK